MPRLKPIDPAHATGLSRDLLDAVHEKLGMTPNLVRTLANSPAALRGYLAFGEALDDASLSPQLREQIALTVSEANGCGYCVAAHCAIGKTVGLSDDQLHDARTSTSPDARTETVLRFARQLVENRASVSDEEIERVRRAGFGDTEITEVIAVVAWKSFANYFNHVAETEVDFPPVADAAA